MNLWEMFKVLLVGYRVPAEMLDPRYPAMLQNVGGLALTFAITLLSLVLGAPLALALTFLKTKPAEYESRPRRAAPVRGLGRVVAAGFVEVVRGVPIMLLVLLTFFLPYRLFHLRVPPVLLAVATFSLYSSAYLTEIFRSGLHTVETGWAQAGRVLGLTPRQVFLRIQLPIAARAMAPDIVSLAITVFKDTSVLVVVAVGELTYTGRLLQMSEPVNYATVLLLTLALYWSVATAGSVLAGALQRRWRHPLVPETL